MRSIPVGTTRLTLAALADGVAELRARDGALDAVVARYGAPPLWGRRAGFATLVRIILEQQVTLASGRAAFARLLAAAGGADAESVAALSIGELRRAGLTRQKADYVRVLARAVVRRELDLRRLARLSDDEVRRTLTAQKGIGPWTAEIYMLMALRRPDAWPAGDLALAVAAREVIGLRATPSVAELERLAESWRPWRAVAARILWRQYLATRGR